MATLNQQNIAQQRNCKESYVGTCIVRCHLKSDQILCTSVPGCSHSHMFVLKQCTAFPVFTLFIAVCATSLISCYYGFTYSKP